MLVSSKIVVCYHNVNGGEILLIVKKSPSYISQNSGEFMGSKSGILNTLKAKKKVFFYVIKQDQMNV